MKNSSVLTAVLGILLVALGMVSCETNSTKKPDSASPSPTKSAKFLETDYEPLEKFFEERFEVEYANMTPQVIFDQVPINLIHYDTEKLPKGPVFELKSDNISRREILKEIADFWDLKMTIKNGDDGNPSAVHVKGKG